MPADHLRTSRWARTAHLVLQAALFLTLVIGLNYLAGSHEWRFDLTRYRRYSLSPETNTGDGILAGERAQGGIEQDIKSPALWMPSSVMQRPDGHTSVFPHIMLDRAKPGVIAVNSSGRRFVNEANSYHDFVEAMLRSLAEAGSGCAGAQRC